SAQIREILISESAWEEMTCLFAPSLGKNSFNVHCQDATGRVLNCQNPSARNYSNSLLIPPTQLLLWKLAKMLTIWHGNFRKCVIKQS
ncbi:hypothetical protein EXX32_25635, partial [Escherichia coli]